MSWVKLDDRFPDNTKIARLSDAAFRAYITSICYCARELTDGIISARKAKEYAGRPKVVQELTPHLWEPRADGNLLVHDYLKYNPTRAEALKAKAEISQHRSEAGKKGMASRWQGDNKTDNSDHNKPHNPVTPIPEGDLNNPLPNPDPRHPPPGDFGGDVIGKVMSDFAKFGTVNELTVDRIEESVETYTLDWVQRAVKQSAKSKAGGEHPGWSHPEGILKSWREKGEPDDDKPRLQTTGHVSGRRPRGPASDADVVDGWQRYKAGEG